MPDPDDAPWTPEPHPMPEHFFSDETGSPFVRCVECERELADMDAPYMVQKCSNGRETVFEFAICAPCAERLHSSYSDASRRAIAGFFHSKIDLDERVRTLREAGEADLDRWIGDCMACGDAPRPGEGFATAALCAGLEILYSHAPFRICGRCELSLNELISPETRGEWDPIYREEFRPAPGGCADPGRPIC